jgi:hypothetical protein
MLRRIILVVVLVVVPCSCVADDPDLVTLVKSLMQKLYLSKPAVV